MNRTNAILSALVKVAAVVALTTAGLFLFHFDRRMEILLDNVDATSAMLNHRLYDKEGIADVAQEILNRSSGLVEVTKNTAKQQRKYWDTMGKKEIEIAENIDATLLQFQELIKQTGGNLNATTDDIHGVLNALATDLNSLNPVLDESKDVLAETRKALADLDANLINDPDIKKSLSQITAILTHTDGITSNVEKMSADVEDKFHHYLYGKPSLKSRIMVALTIAYKAALLRNALMY